MKQTSLLVSLLVISSCFILLGAQKSPFASEQSADTSVRFFGTVDLPEAKEGVFVKSAQ